MQARTHDQDPLNQQGLQHPSKMPEGKVGVPPGGEGGQYKGTGYAGGVDQGPSQTHGVGGSTVTQPLGSGHVQPLGTAQPQQQQFTSGAHYQQQQGLSSQQQGLGSQQQGLGSQQPGYSHQQATDVHHDAPITGFVADPQSASEKPLKKEAKDRESDAHRMAQQAAEQSKQQNKTIMNDPNASVGTKVSAAGHAFKDWATEKKHGMQADHHEKKAIEKERRADQQAFPQQPQHQPATTVTAPAGGGPAYASQPTTTAPAYPKPTQFEGDPSKRL